MKVVNTVKLLAGITDNEQDDVILALEEMTRNQLSMMVDETSVPPPLEAVVLPVTLARFNRLQSFHTLFEQVDRRAIFISQSR